MHQCINFLFQFFHCLMSLLAHFLRILALHLQQFLQFLILLLNLLKLLDFPEQCLYVDGISIGHARSLAGPVL